MRAVACSLHMQTAVDNNQSERSWVIAWRFDLLTQWWCLPREGMGWVSGPVAGTLHASSRPPLHSSMTPQTLPPSFNNSNHRTSKPPPSSNGLPLAALLALQSSDHRMRLGTLSTVLTTGGEEAGKYHGDPADKIISTQKTQSDILLVDSDNLLTAKNLSLAPPGAGRRRHPILLPQRLYGSSSLNEDAHSWIDFIDIPFGGPLASYKEKLLCTALCESQVAGLLPMRGGWGERALVPCPALVASPFSSTSPAFTSPPV
ncbi:uncharacterized protein IWZ02DRAFT_513875 [Phyllosticta citriasiana]|uniref:uncharacterized protein n=1 Tax=Phyllosticta citriasiana TaxID=595635 RepID=UPI0030FDD0EA